MPAVSRNLAGFGVFTFLDGGSLKIRRPIHRRPDGRFGVYHWRNGNSYAGQRAERMRSGHGVLRLANGARYEGAWAADQHQQPGVNGPPMAASAAAGIWTNDQLTALNLNRPSPGREPRAKARSAGERGPMADLFISYKREDRQFAERLSIALEQLGFDVWWDFDLMSGDRFRRVIEKVIDECSAAIVLWSNCRAKADSWSTKPPTPTPSTRCARRASMIAACRLWRHARR